MDLSLRDIKDKHSQTLLKVMKIEFIQYRLTVGKRAEFHSHMRRGD